MSTDPLKTTSEPFRMDWQLVSRISDEIVTFSTVMVAESERVQEEPSEPVTVTV